MEKIEEITSFFEIEERIDISAKKRIDTREKLKSKLMEMEAALPPLPPPKQAKPRGNSGKVRR